MYCTRGVKNAWKTHLQKMREFAYHDSLMKSRMTVYGIEAVEVRVAFFNIRAF